MRQSNKEVLQDCGREVKGALAYAMIGARPKTGKALAVHLVQRAGRSGQQKRRQQHNRRQLGQNRDDDMTSAGDP